MKYTNKATALAASALLAISLSGCGGNKEQAGSEQATIDPAGNMGTGQTGAMGATLGTSSSAGQAIGTYLQQTGADATGQTFPLEQVTFASGSSNLDAAGQSALGEVAMMLKQHPNAVVTITSYADPQGDAAANKKLAAARAVSVKNALSAAGVPAAKLMTNVVGEAGSAPIAENRQVELMIKRG